MQMLALQHSADHCKPLPNREMWAQRLSNLLIPHKSACRWAGISQPRCHPPREMAMVAFTKAGDVMEGTMTGKWIAVAFLVLAGMSGAHAQDYPTRTVTVIVPFAAGGPADIT